MTSNPSGPYHERAIRHEARARNYRRQAELMRERDADLDCAAALLYESAKQCINAVGNQRGQNPGTTGGKVNVIRGRLRLEIPHGDCADAELATRGRDSISMRIVGNLTLHRIYAEAWEQAQVLH